ncbi:MAG: kinase [Pseudomonadales bacterium]|nr:kinase [Pseudomonadales bacterium]
MQARPDVEDTGIQPIAIVITIIVTIIVTVVSLEMTGKIRHTDNKEDVVIAEYKAIFLQQGDSHRLSTKPSVQTAICKEGFIVVVSDTDPQMRALIVDYKNRGIKCTTGQ